MSNESSKAKRIVVKIGTSTLTHQTGSPNLRRMEELCKVMSDVKNSGVELVLVSSGAIEVGRAKLGVPKRQDAGGHPEAVSEKQALAAIGQCELMNIYSKLFGIHSHQVAQLLITRDVVENEHRRQNSLNTFETILRWKVIPIVNENDTVSIDEISENDTFGDNDKLSAIVAGLTGADMLIMLTDTDGLYDSDPRKNPAAKLIERVSGEVTAIAGDSGGSRGTGGMRSKVAAAQMAAWAGIETVIVNGSRPENIYKALDGERVGTRFEAKSDLLISPTMNTKGWKFSREEANER